MNEYSKEIIEIGKDISITFKTLNLFGIFEREDIQNKWDVIISTPLGKLKKNTILEKVVTFFNKRIPQEGLLKISRFIYLEPEHPFVLNINRVAKVNIPATLDLNNSTLNNVFIKHALIFSSKRTINTPPTTSHVVSI